MTSHLDQPDAASTAASRPSNRWQQLRALADLSIVVAEGLSLHEQIKNVLHKSGFSSKVQPASRTPRLYSPDELCDESDAESELDERDEEYLPIPSRADRRALANVTLAVGLRPRSGKRAPHVPDVACPSTGAIQILTAATEEPASPVDTKTAKGKRRRNGCRKRSSPSRRKRSRTPEPPSSPPVVVDALPLPLADEGSRVHKRRRRGMGRRRQPRANLDPVQKLQAKAEDKQRRKRSRITRLHAILTAAETTQRRMRSQVACKSHD